MKDQKELLACCGLYCGDCAGYSGEIAEAAVTLKERIHKYKFDQTAKNLFSKELRDYDKLHDMLGFMTTLKCAKPCREKATGETSCEIRKCCFERRFYACHECNDFERCDKLKPLSGLHGESCINN